MKMKIVISVLSVGLCAFAAQANSILGTVFTSTELPLGGNPDPSFTIQSEVTALGGGEYLYQYFSPSPGTYNNVTGIDDFTVYFASAVTSSIFAENSPSPFSWGISSGHVTWTATGDTTASETFSFESPLPPTWGYANALDDGNWSDQNNGLDLGVLVPGVPDGGLTVALLGGALTAMVLVRSKVGKLN